MQEYKKNKNYIRASAKVLKSNNLRHFADTKYYPADETFSYYMKSSDFNPQNAKYAELSLNGEKSKITVMCDEFNDSIICSKQGGNTYYYLKEAVLDFTVEDFDSFQLYSGSVANNTPKYEFSKNADEYWHGGLYDNEEAVAFLNYYNSPKKELDSKKTEQYLGNISLPVCKELSEFGRMQIVFRRYIERKFSRDYI